MTLDISIQFGEIVNPPPAIEPLPEPTFGWRPAPDDLIVFVAHDPQDQPYRVEGGTSNQFSTNETRRQIFEYDPVTDTVYYNRFMTVQLHNHKEYVADIELKNGRRILDLFCSKGFGWCDTNPVGNDPYGDNNTYGVIDCGGNRRRGIKKVKDSKGREYVIVEMVHAVGTPPAYTYETHPHLVQKQNLVYNRTQLIDRLFWGTSPQGDVEWLNMAPRQYAAYLIWNQPDNRAEVDFYPQTPFNATLHGYDVTVWEYCLQGSTTLVRVTGELTGWYVAEESPNAGMIEPYPSLSWRDYKRYIEHPDWPGPTVQTAGWRKSY